MSDFSRADRVADEVHKSLSEAMITSAGDERLRAVSISAVKLSPDLRLATVYWLVLGNDDPDARTRKRLQGALEGARGFLRASLSKKLNLRNTPELRFFFDDTTEQGRAVADLIEELHVAPDLQQGDEEE